MGPGEGPGEKISQRKNTGPDCEPNAVKRNEAAFSVRRDLVPDEIPGEIDRVIKYAEEKVTVTPEQRRAWYQDCSYMIPLVKSTRKALAEADGTRYIGLVHLAQSWEQGMQSQGEDMKRGTVANVQIVS